jgi:hypothetical protein
MTSSLSFGACAFLYRQDLQTKSREERRLRLHHEPRFVLAGHGH